MNSVYQRVSGGALALALVASPLLGGCMTTSSAEGTQGERRAAIPLELDAPLTSKILADGKHTRYLVKVPEAGKLKVVMSWTNPLAVEKMLVQTGNRQIETELLRDKTRVEHVTEAIAGFYYIELIPGEEADSYNLVVTLEPGAKTP